jgi:hypothetical protein
MAPANALPFSKFPLMSSKSCEVMPSLTSPLSMNDFLISALSLSSSCCFLLLSRASRLACLSSSF